MSLPRHIGALTTSQIVDWAVQRGATPASARMVARTLVGRYAGRNSEFPASRRLLAEAESHFADGIPEASPTPDPDGTIRYAVRLEDGQVVESVAIPHPGRTTICLSTQAGCARGCVFCETGRLGLFRNLSTEEITGQLAAVSRHLASEGRTAPTNLVFMGMGEPLDNLDSVLAAVDVMTDDCGFAIAPRRVTISTVGVVPKMRELYRRSRCRIAVSLHSANDGERAALLPVARSWGLAELKQAISEAPETVLLQWTLIAGVNDTDRHLRELLDFCQGLDVRVNLIPLNPGPEEQWSAPKMDHVRAFQKRLRDAGIRALVRMPHGQAVGGACGQLAGEFRGDPRLREQGPVIGKSRLVPLGSS